MQIILTATDVAAHQDLLKQALILSGCACPVEPLSKDDGILLEVTDPSIVYVLMLMLAQNEKQPTIAGKYEVKWQPAPDLKKANDGPVIQPLPEDEQY